MLSILNKKLICSELKQILSKAHEQNNYNYTLDEVKERLEKLIEVLE